MGNRGKGLRKKKTTAGYKWVVALQERAGNGQVRGESEQLSGGKRTSGKRAEHDAGLLFVLQRRDGTKGRAFNRQEKNPNNFFGSNIESALS